MNTMRHEENNAGEGLDQAGDQGRDQLNRPAGEGSALTCEEDVRQASCMRPLRRSARRFQGRGAFRSRRGARALPQSPLRRLDGMVREVQQAGKGAGPRRRAPLRGVEQPARAERHGPLCLRDDGRDDLGADKPYHQRPLRRH